MFDNLTLKKDYVLSDFGIAFAGNLRGYLGSTQKNLEN